MLRSSLFFTLLAFFFFRLLLRTCTLIKCIEVNLAQHIHLWTVEYLLLTLQSEDCITVFLLCNRLFYSRFLGGFNWFLHLWFRLRSYRFRSLDFLFRLWADGSSLHFWSLFLFRSSRLFSRRSFTNAVEINLSHRFIHLLVRRFK